MNAPDHLSHKPIIVVNGYDRIDGHYAGKTDAMALSIGIAQYDSNEISAKIFRHSGVKWSRQSEELPIHRNLDLTILILSTMVSTSHSVSSMNVTVSDPSSVKKVSDYYKKHRSVLDPRLAEIKRLINIIVP